MWNLCLKTLTRNVDNACWHSSFMAIVHACQAGSAQFSPTRLSSGGVYLSWFPPKSFLETISQAIVEREPWVIRTNELILVHENLTAKLDNACR